MILDSQCFILNSNVIYVEFQTEFENYVLLSGKQKNVKEADKSFTFGGKTRFWFWRCGSTYIFNFISLNPKTSNFLCLPAWHYFTNFDLSFQKSSTRIVFKLHRVFKINKFFSTNCRKFSALSSLVFCFYVSYWAGFKNSDVKYHLFRAWFFYGCICVHILLTEENF